MAGHVVLKKEIFQGIFGGLGMILVVVVIGSLIGSALSHGHEEAPAGDAVEAIQPAADATADPAEGGAEPTPGAQDKEAPAADAK